MKKILLLFLFLLFPSIVNAYVDYDITDYLIDATILDNGDLSVKELIVLDGSFNGYVRDLVYKNSNLIESDSFSNNAIYNAKGINNVKVYANTLEEEPSFNTLNEVFLPLTRAYFDSEAVNTNYVESSIQNGKSYKMYYKANNEMVGFLLNYTIDDAVVIHNDVAELYWTFIGDGFEDAINNLQIKVHLPGEDTSEMFRVWAHGDIAGLINKTDNKTVLATMKSLKRNSPVDLRITFDKNLILDKTTLNKTNKEALNAILEVENKRALVREEEIKKAKFIYNLVSVISTIFFVTLIIWWIYVYFKYDREYKSDFTNKYNREFILDYNVEVVDYLMKGTITPNAMAASILNLIYKKNIKVEETGQDKKKKDYTFTLVNRDNVNDTEDVLLDFLFETVGSNNQFTSVELDKYAKGSRTYNTFQSKYNNWLNCVRKDGEQCNFYEKNGKPIIVGIFVLLIGILISFAVIYYHVNFILSYLVFPLSLVYLIYSLMLKRRTKKGNEDYVRWKAFKRFLEDFGSFETKELPAISLWERYLVYATVFGLAKEVEEAMNTKIHEFGEFNNEYVYYPSWVDIHIANTINSLVTNSINGANTASARAAGPTNSSGFGGGFSSGGGFGGGGGGGHGF